MNRQARAASPASFCVIGAGAVGAHMAARLALSGHPVSVLARGPQLSAIQHDGIRVELPGQVLHAGSSLIRASDDPCQLGPADYVLVTVKSPSIPSVAPLLSRVMHDRTSVVFAQNGIPWWYFHGLANPSRLIASRLNIDKISSFIPSERVLGCVIHSSSHITRPGVVSVERLNNRLILGEPNGFVSERGERCVGALAASGFQAELSDRIRDEIWLKLALNAATGPQCVLADSSLGDTFRDSYALESLRVVAREMQGLARTLGCSTKLDGVDIEAFISRISGTRHRPSILQDFDLGRAVEIDALYRLPVELARENGVAVPMLGLLSSLVQRRAIAAGLAEDH